MKKLSLKEMQDLLPDYAFKRLNRDNTGTFENNIGSYPELQSELNELNEVFNNAEKFDFDAMMKENSKNLSVKVQKRIKENQQQVKGLASFKFAVPTFALLIMAYLTFFEGIFETSEQKQETEIVSSNLISESELSAIFEDENMDEEVYYHQSNIDIYSLIENNEVSYESNLEFLSDLEIEQSELASLHIYIDTDEILKDISEDEFLELIRNIKNEKFNV